MKLRVVVVDVVVVAQEPNNWKYGKKLEFNNWIYVFSALREVVTNDLDGYIVNVYKCF